METLTHGFKKPQLDDDSTDFMPAMEDNIQQLNDHLHNGTDSAVILASVQSIDASAWVAVAGNPGTYSRTLTMPTGYSFDTCSVLFKLANGSVIYPTVTRVSASSYTVYVNDNTLVLSAVFSS